MEQREWVKAESITLMTLPPEILIKIFSHLSVPFGKPTIQAVLRTCKKLYEIALPVSVRVFRNAAHSIEGSGPCSRARNTRFLRYILISKPWLAKYVRIIAIGRFSGDDGGNGQDQVATTDEELAVYQQHINFILGQLPSSYTNSWCAAWVEDLRNNTSDAQVALILLTCPNVQTLLYEMPQCARNFLRLINMVRNLTDINTSIHTPGSGWGEGGNYPEMVIPLSNVQDVCQETLTFKTGYREFCMEAPEFFAFPRLRFFESIMANGLIEAAEKFRALPRRSSSVEEITLQYAYICVDTLRDMLGACRVLKKFDFTHARLTGSPDLIVPRDILNAILPHADTLEGLYLNLEEIVKEEGNWPNYHPDVSNMGVGLRQMHALKRLTLSMQALTGIFSRQQMDDTRDPKMPLGVEGAAEIVDCLPENLEYLKIRNCGVPILDQATELIRVVEQGHRFKKLAYIGLMFSQWIKEDDKAKIKRLTCNAANVRFELIFQTYETETLALGLGIQIVDANTERGRVLMSRIYAQHVRKQYLESRGHASYRELDFEFDDPDWFEE